MAAEAPKRRWISQEVKEGLAVARTLRSELGLRDEEPVPCLIELAEQRLAVEVVVVPLREAVSGFYLPVRPQPIVVVSDRHPVPRQRFTLAHEIAHHALGHGAAPRIQETAPVVDDEAAGGAARGAAAETAGPAAGPSGTATAALTADPSTSPAPVPESHYTPQKSVDPNERAANAFAGELLIPDAGAATVAAPWADEPPLDQAVRLSAHYGVSAFAAIVKLQLLGVLDKPTVDATRDRLRTLDHLARYDELGLLALDDELQRHRDAGGGIRCSPRARTVVRRLLGELSAA